MVAVSSILSPSLTSAAEKATATSVWSLTVKSTVFSTNATLEVPTIEKE